MSQAISPDEFSRPEPTVPTSVLSFQTLWYIPLAAALTPLLIFLIPATILFERYGADSFFDVSILVPFWKNTVVTWIIGTAILAGEVLMSHKNNRASQLPIMRFFGWIYLLSGPVFPVKRPFYEITEFMFYMISPLSLIVPVFLLVLVLLLVGRLSRRISPAKVSFVFAAVSLFIILIEAGVFIGRL
jgi:hypothetical protein